MATGPQISRDSGHSSNKARPDDVVLYKKHMAYLYIYTKIASFIQKLPNAIDKEARSVYDRAHKRERSHIFIGRYKW